MQWSAIVEWTVIVLAAVGVLVAVVVSSRRAERARREALQQAGLAMGFSFDAEGDLDQMRALGNLPLYGHGHSRQVKNVLGGRAASGDVRIFDYQYSTGGDKESQTWKQTVAIYPGGGQGLPDFVLSPENLFHKIGQLLGYRDIDFDSSPVFSARYLLRGPDDAAIRAVFPSETRAYFEQEQGWSVEVQAGSVGIYRSGKRIKPDELPTFVETTQAVLRAIARR